MEERGAGGGTVRLWSAVPSPGHKKAKIQAKLKNSKNFKLYHFTYNKTAFAGEKPSQSSHKFVLRRFASQSK